MGITRSSRVVNSDELTTFQKLNLYRKYTVVEFSKDSL
jgi:hypothetical protein